MAGLYLSEGRIFAAVLRLTSSAALFDPGPGVFEGDRAVEDKATGSRIGVDAEVAEPFELVACPGGHARDARLELAACQHFERAGVQLRAIVINRRGILARKQPIVQADFDLDRVRG